MFAVEASSAGEREREREERERPEMRRRRAEQVGIVSPKERGRKDLLAFSVLKNVLGMGN